MKKIRKILTPPAPTAHEILTARGHTEQPLGSGIVCQTCLARKPKRGGWSLTCPGDTRPFMGG